MTAVDAVALVSVALSLKHQTKKSFGIAATILVLTLYMASIGLLRDGQPARIAGEALSLAYIAVGYMAASACVHRHLFRSMVKALAALVLWNFFMTILVAVGVMDAANASSTSAGPASGEIRVQGGAEYTNTLIGVLLVTLLIMGRKNLKDVWLRRCLYLGTTCALATFLIANARSLLISLAASLVALIAIAIRHHAAIARERRILTTLPRLAYGSLWLSIAYIVVFNTDNFVRRLLQSFLDRAVLRLAENSLAVDLSARWRATENGFAVEAIRDSLPWGIGLATRYRPYVLQDTYTFGDVGPYYLHNAALWVPLRGGAPVLGSVLLLVVVVCVRAFRRGLPLASVAFPSFIFICVSAPFAPWAIDNRTPLLVGVIIMLSSHREDLSGALQAWASQSDLGRNSVRIGD